MIVRQEYEIKEKNHDIVKKDLQLKEISEAYEALYREFERYKQLNPDSGKPVPTTPYDLVNNILGGKDEMEWGIWREIRLWIRKTDGTIRIL